jgi:general L-amino acid transport system substrate-binding protein
VKRLAILLLALGLVLAACDSSSDDTTTTTAADGGATETTTADGGATETTTAPAAATGSLLQTVQDRGSVICGVNDAVPGFGYTDAEGNFSGFDVDYCRAVAAAVLGDAEAVTYRPLTAQQRFTALQSGEIDVLIRNTTFTSSRDGREGATFLTTTFYDGQGMMVYADSGITSIDDMANLAVCVLSGTTTELNLAARFGSTPFTPLTFDANDQLQAAFVAGQCDGWTSDKSQLAGVRSNFPESQGGPEALVILDETFSKEPLGPVVIDGDTQWAQAVNWVVLSTIQAEEWDLTSANVASYSGDDSAIRRFLGLEVETDEGTTVFDPGVGLPTDFAAQVIAQVGNYAEIFDRNVGPDTALGLPRGVNALWTDGGLLYSPPYR